VDVAEIDGASNNGVDEVRALRENVKYLPASARFKVYIIDEVHMLSAAAFNALLKTLEEPPPHVKFVFATTEVQKLPATILSRCQRFDFRRIGLDTVTQRLSEIVQAEGIAASDRALALIARQGDGSMRDAQSLLDQVIAYTGAAGVTDQAVREVLGISDRDAVLELAAALLGRDAGAALRQLDALYRGGADLRQLARDLLEHVRHLLLARVAGPDALAAELTPEEAAEAAARAATRSIDELQALVGLLVRGEEELARSPAPRLALEVTLIRMARAAELRPLGEILADLEALGARLSGGAAAGAPASGGPTGGAGTGQGGPAAAARRPSSYRAGARDLAEAPKGPAGTADETGRAAPRGGAVEASAPAGGTARPAKPTAADGDGSSLSPETWAAAVAFVAERKPSLGAILEEAVLLEVGSGSVTLGLPPGSPFHEDTLAAAAASGLLGDLLEQATRRRYQVRVGAVPEGAAPLAPSLAESAEGKARRQQEALKAEAMTHPVVQAAAELFDLDPDALAVKPLAS
jgi:DNA polymerase-3 subunit gamma/tau